MKGVFVNITAVLTVLINCLCSAGYSQEQIELPPAEMSIDDLRRLMIDLGSTRLCSHLSGQIMELSGNGSSGQGGNQLTTGVLWIRECDTREVSPEVLEVTVSGIGWRWLSRSPEQAGAEFEIDENIRFSTTISMQGTFDMAYDPQNHIVTLWFVPVDPVDVEFRLTGNVQVETEGLWSSIVGGAASIFGQSPAQRAEERIRQESVRSFRSRLSRGMTVIFDLCTGQRYVRLGDYAAGSVPAPAVSPQGRRFLVNDRARMYNSSMLLAGQFEPGESPLVAEITAVSGGPLIAYWVCRDDAERIAETYVQDNNVSQIPAVAQQTVQPGKTVQLRAPQADCPLVLITRPTQGATLPVTFEYVVYRQGEEQEPIVECN